jgi:saccharopine dehydrogenase-like NADP-dependent oxidoreductase
MVKALALLGLGLAPGLVQLLATLFLQDPRELGFKAAIDLFLGQADAQEAV